MRQKGRVGGAGILKELSSARGKTQDSVMVRLPGLYGNKKKYYSIVLPGNFISLHQYLTSDS